MATGSPWPSPLTLNKKQETVIKPFKELQDSKISAAANHAPRTLTARHGGANGMHDMAEPMDAVMDVQIRGCVHVMTACSSKGQTAPYVHTPFLRNAHKIKFWWVLVGSDALSGGVLVMF
jgi:hypothetical protein